MQENIQLAPFYDEAFKLFHNSFVVNLLPILAVVLMAFLTCQTLFFSDSPKGEKKSGNILFISVGIFTMFIYRGLTYYSDMLNVDEANQLTGVMNFLADRRLWISHDSTTLGPVAFLPVVFAIDLLHLFGIDFPVTFFMARIVVSLLLSGAFIFLYKICRNNLSVKYTRVVLLFFIFYFSFYYGRAYFQNMDLMAYNWEYVYLFFITWILYLIDKHHKPNNRCILLTGFLCGLLPWMKLQAIPMMAVVELWLLYLIWKNAKEDTNTNFSSKFWLKTVYLIGATLVPTLILLTHLLINGSVRIAYKLYIENAQTFVIPIFSVSFLKELLYIIKYYLLDRWYNLLFAPMALSIVLYFVAKKKVTQDLMFSFLFFAASLFALLRPVSAFDRYMIFMSAPILLIFIKCIKISRLFDVAAKHEKYLSIGIVLLWLFMFHDFFGNVRAQAKDLQKDGLITESLQYNTDKAITEYVIEHTTPDDYIVMWGYDHQIFLYTQRKSATAQNDIYRLHRNFLHYNIEKYIADIKRNKPKLIIDLTPFISFNIYFHSLENHEVWNYIKDDYQLAKTIPVNNIDVNIYTRSEK